jgi:hypothetical protein
MPVDPLKPPRIEAHLGRVNVRLQPRSPAHRAIFAAARSDGQAQKAKTAATGSRRSNGQG